MTAAGSNSAAALQALAQKINAEHEAAATSLRRGVEHAIRAGELLNEAKALVAHGQWLPWLRQNFAGSERSAQLYMRVAKQKAALSESASLADLTLEGAAELLAKPKDRTLVPPTGQMLIGLLDHEGGQDVAYVMPSASAERYHVAKFWLPPGEAVPHHVRGTARPVRADALALTVELMGFPIARAAWGAQPYEGPLDRNAWVSGEDFRDKPDDMQLSALAQDELEKLLLALRRVAAGAE